MTQYEMTQSAHCHRRARRMQLPNYWHFRLLRALALSGHAAAAPPRRCWCVGKVARRNPGVSDLPGRRVGGHLLSEKLYQRARRFFSRRASSYAWRHLVEQKRRCVQPRPVHKFLNRMPSPNDRSHIYSIASQPALLNVREGPPPQRG
jgi:hypothetical protein